MMLWGWGKGILERNVTDVRGLGTWQGSVGHHGICSRARVIVRVMVSRSCIRQAGSGISEAKGRWGKGSLEVMVDSKAKAKVKAEVKAVVAKGIRDGVMDAGSKVTKKAKANVAEVEPRRWT